MADELTLQSFVIRLKYFVDQTSEKQFQNSVQKGIGGLNALRLTLVGLAVGFEEAVRRSTNYYNTLAGLSNLTGASAGSIEKMRAGFQGAHMSAQQFDSTLQQLAQSFRMMPGMADRAGALVGMTGVTAARIPEFLQRAAEHYRELQARGDQGGMVAYLHNLDVQLPGLSDQIVGIANNWDRFNRFMRDTDEIYKRLHTGADQAKTDAEGMDEAFFRVGKTLQVAFAEFLTHKGPNGKSVAEAIEEIANKFADWLASDEAQQKFIGFLDTVSDLLPLIEVALDHIQAIMIGFAAFKFAGFIAKLWEIVSAFRAMQLALAGGSAAAGGAAAGGAAAAGGMGLLGAAGVVGLVWGVLQLARSSGFLTGAGGPMWDPAWGPPPPDWKGGVAGQHQKGDTPDFIDRFNAWLHGEKVPDHYQQGGIVPINAHAGEMVLPVAISQGLQSFFMGGTGGFMDFIHRLLDSFLGWFAGDTSYRPQVSLSEDTLDRMGYGSKDKPQQQGTGGTGGGAGAGEGAGGGGAGGGAGGGGGGGGPGGTRQGPSGRAGAVLPVPDVDHMTAEERNTLGLILKYESMGGHNVLNQIGVKMGVSPTQARGYTAQGYYQMLNSNWRKIAPLLNIKEQNAMAASFEDQTRVALYLLRHGGVGNWANWNSVLAAALRAREQVKFAPPGTTEPPGAPAPGSPMGQIQAVIGDSIGEGLAGALKLRGQDVISGTTPQQILARVAKHINDYAGKTVALASGSNPNAGFDPAQMEAVRQTEEMLHKVGAHVALLGVGTGVKDYQRINAKLAEIAKAYGDPFTGVLAGTEGGRVHPARYDYQPIRRQVEQVMHSKVDINVHGNDSPSTTAKATKHAFDRTAAEHTRHMRPRAA